LGGGKLLRHPAQQLLFLGGKELTPGRNQLLNLVKTKGSMKRPSNFTSLRLALFISTATLELFAGDLSTQSARRAPQWLQDGVIYEVFPRDFSGNGDFNGITARLDELKDLGVNVLWLMPIHPIGEKMRKGTMGSPYAVRDYYAINPAYGTEADLKHLVAEAHQRELKVILDIVANHTAWDSVLMQHPEFYKQDANGRIIPPVPEWTDVAGLNYENPKLREQMIDMLKHWMIRPRLTWTVFAAMWRPWCRPRFGSRPERSWSK
jgi:pullulanase/glycogen debranching enzyme